MGAEQNKAMVRQAVEEIFNKQNPDAVDKYHTADFINHDPNLPQVRSMEEYKQWIRAIKTAYPLPGYRVLTDDIIAESDRVVVAGPANQQARRQYSPEQPSTGL